MLADKFGSIPEQWKNTLWAILAVILLSIVIFYDTWAQTVSTWAGTKTYNHGFVVAPISLWLIWSRLHIYQYLHPRISWEALGVVLLGGLIWLIADLSHVLVGKEFAVVVMLISAIWVVLGNQVAASMAFPLLFLLFMVPVGDQLVTPLMDYTANFTVYMLRLTGLSVYREGTFFSLTSGSWSVVEACSGINYLIASVTLGFVFAYLNYQSYWKRALFMLLSIIVPIVANGFRAYMIVMIGHLSGMKLAVGVDHIIYGGIFFGFVMLLLFYLGSFWRDPVVVPAIPPQVSAEAVPSVSTPTGSYWSAIAAIALSFMIWPQTAALLANKHSSEDLPAYLSKISPTGWQIATKPTHWEWAPKYQKVVGEKTDYYTNGSRVVGVYHASFGREEQGRELVNSLNVLLPSEAKDGWRKVENSALKIGELTADEAVLNKENLDLLVLEWYQLGDKLTANSYRAKYYQLLKRLTADTTPELKVVVWTETIHDNHVAARVALQEFMRDWFEQQQRIWVVQ